MGTRIKNWMGRLMLDIASWLRSRGYARASNMAFRLGSCDGARKQ